MPAAKVWTIDSFEPSNETDHLARLKGDSHGSAEPIIIQLLPEGSRGLAGANTEKFLKS